MSNGGQEPASPQPQGQHLAAPGVPAGAASPQSGIRWAWVILSALPFLIVYLAHFAATPGVGSGFIHEDLPYYAANGREIFERGNGFAYPNPYDPDPDAPVIYFHWLLWLFGAAIHLGVDPGMLFVVATLAGAFLMAAVTWMLVSVVLPRPDFRVPLFLLVMWGGGILCLTQMAANLTQQAPLLSNLLAFDPGRGLWFLNWGRNVLFPTESTYHALVAASWCCALTRRYNWALVSTALLAATHPWSGLELLLTMAAFHFLRMLFLDGRRAVLHWLVSVACLGAFLNYNLIWLNSFPQHRVIQQTWELDWRVPDQTVLLAWLPVFGLAAGRLILDSSSRNRQTLLLLIAFAVAFSLSVHDRFMSPKQPLHFTRGYVWLPLTLLALPLLQEWLIRAEQYARKPVFHALLVSGLLLAAVDNLVFLTEQSRSQLSDDGDGFQFAAVHEKNLLRQINAQSLTGVAVVMDEELSYLLATYTPLTPYAGHQFNTPEYESRRRHIAALAGSATFHDVPWLNSVRYVLSSPQASAFPDNSPPEGWEVVLESGPWQLFERPL